MARPPRPRSIAAGPARTMGLPASGRGIAPAKGTGSRSRLASIGLVTMAHTDPGAKSQGRRTPTCSGSPSRGRSASAASLDTAEEVIRVGHWSVRRLPSAGTEASLFYVDTTSGAIQTEPPQEVLFALDMDEDGDDLPPPADEVADPGRRIDPNGTGGGSSTVAGDDETDGGNDEPQFRRIVLGAQHDTPLRMARDLLEAVREDKSIFSELQRHFSDFPSESLLSLDTLPQCLELSAAMLDPGDVSDVLATESGMQILLRVA